jgi:hypothetical protein
MPLVGGGAAPVLLGFGDGVCDDIHEHSHVGHSWESDPYSIEDVRGIMLRARARAHGLVI